LSERRWGFWLLLAATTGAGWGCTSPSLVATVEIPAALKSTCTRVVALAGGAEITSQMVPRPAGTDPLQVAIFEPQGQARDVTAIARGYVGRGCDEPLLLNEESAPAAAEFKLGGGSVTLTLLPPPPALDGDGDGYRAASAGGPDCDDRLASVYLGAAENCGDLADNDCDGRADCAQPSCLNHPCGSGRSCTQSGICLGQETACTNGLDDDLDGLPDCLDPDCAAASCNDGNPCTTLDACQAGQCQGTPISCNSPPASECLDSAGTCNPADGRCRYPSRSGQACSAGVCDHGGACGPLYSYAPANFTPPDAGDFVPLRFDCGRANLDTDPAAATPFSGALCGQTLFPALIDKAQLDAGNAVIVPVERLAVASGSDLVVSGPRPVIFAVFGDAEIDGRIWFNAGQGPVSNGAGVTTQCGSGVGQNGGNAGTSAAGGGGGSHGTAGARGGNGTGSTGGNAGTAFGGPTLVPLFGGCAGGAGGNDGANAGAGPGGGGGAIQLSATGSVTVRGAVGAPGGGGGGGRNHETGGGGGGAGGSVLLEGTSVRVSPTGLVTANGGGGGAGDSCCASGFADGSGGGGGSVDTLNRAGGGGSTAGGAGGQGAAGTQAAGQGGNGGTLPLPTVTYYGGGGGGGGGLGRIRINATGSCQLDGGFSGVLTGNQGGANGCP